MLQDDFEEITEADLEDEVTEELEEEGFVRLDVKQSVQEETKKEEIIEEDDAFSNEYEATMRLPRFFFFTQPTVARPSSENEKNNASTISPRQ